MFGLGYGLGGLIGGLVYRHLGARAVYAVAFWVMAGGWAATSAAQCVVAGARRDSACLPGMELVHV